MAFIIVDHWCMAHKVMHVCFNIAKVWLIWSNFTIRFILWIICIKHHLLILIMTEVRNDSSFPFLFNYYASINLPFVSVRICKSFLISIVTYFWRTLVIIQKFLCFSRHSLCWIILRLVHYWISILSTAIDNFRHFILFECRIWFFATILE